MNKDDATWLNVAYVVFTVLAGFFFYKAFETLGLQMDWTERYEWYSAIPLLGGVLLGIGATFYLRSDHDRHEYLLSCITELRKVTWPSWPETKRMTVVVVIVVGIFAVIVSIFDVLWAKALNLLIA
jgi:preprotein translocase subunit SecE